MNRMMKRHFKTLTLCDDMEKGLEHFRSFNASGMQNPRFAVADGVFSKLMFRPMLAESHDMPRSRTIVKRIQR